MKFVDLYTPLPEGDGFEVKQTGALRPPTTRDNRHPRIILDLTIPDVRHSTAHISHLSSCDALGKCVAPITSRICCQLAYPQFPEHVHQQPFLIELGQLKIIHVIRGKDFHTGNVPEHV